MHNWLAQAATGVGLIIEAMALLVIAYGSAEAFVQVARGFFRHATEEERRRVYLRYLRWLVAALTFQLGADIVHTTVAPTWEELGQVGAIALIRTFLAYFLERDMREAEKTT